MNIQTNQVYICRTEQDWDNLKIAVKGSGRQFLVRTEFERNICVKIYENNCTQGSEKYFLNLNYQILEVNSMNYEIY